MDALENVGPEDWPGVARRLRVAARPGAPLYLTVELFEPDDADAGGRDLTQVFRAARARGEPVVPGEDVGEDGGYHYYPGRERALGWLAESGIEVDSTLEADGYLHILGHRPA